MVNLLKLQCSISWRKVCPLSHCERSCAIIVTSISDVWIACPSACRRPLSCDCVLFCWYNLSNKALLFTFLNWSTIEKTWPLRSFTLVTALELWRWSCISVYFKTSLIKECVWRWSGNFAGNYILCRVVKSLLSCHSSAKFSTLVLVLSLVC